MGKGGRPFKVHEDLNQLRDLIEQGNNEAVKGILKNHGVNAFDSDKRTALIWAVFFSNNDLLRWLINQGADLNHQDRNGYTGLHFCGQEQNVAIAQVLLESGADPNVKDQHGNSSLWTALFNARGHFELVKLLRDYGADPTSSNIHGRSPDDMAITIYEKQIDELIE